LVIQSVLSTALHFILLSWLLGSEEVDGRGENFEGAKWLENKLKDREPIGVSVFCESKQFLKLFHLV